MVTKINIKRVKTNLVVVTCLLLIITFGSPVFANPEETNDELSIKALAFALGRTEAVAEGVNKEITAIKAMVEHIAMDDKIKAAVPSAASRMAEIKNIRPTIEMLFLAAPDGNFVASDGNKGSVADQDYFKQAVQKQATVVAGEPVVSKSTGKLVVMVATPVKQNNQIIGFIGAAVNIDAVNNFISEQTIGMTGYAYLVGRSGLIFIHPDKEVRMKRNIASFPIFADMWRAALAGNKVVTQSGNNIFVCMRILGTSWVVYGRAFKDSVIWEITGRIKRIPGGLIIQR
ncbi:cache domain-containing protein [Anaeroselena agilis]|uniref:Cache domain-containing protein n=1 Tax=Anaeroselena agilis TaxID=3063788 RepID=A0ABU3P025_9FIRM|nr:cache domain-containing protein [Selenomonadales bacterium 4137-cl]